MVSEIQRYHTRMGNLFLINLVALLVLPLFFRPFANAADYLVAFAVGLVVLGLVDRRYFAFLFWTVVFVLYLIYEIVVSNIAIAWLVLQPKPKLDPGIIAVPLTVTTGLEITMLASAITLTPGTLSLDLGRDDEGRFVLYVHSLKVDNPEEFRRTIKQGFEQMILRISRGVNR